MHTNLEASHARADTSNASKVAVAHNLLYSDRDAAALLGCGRSTLWRWSAEGVIPRPLKIGGMSRWRLSDLQAVIDAAVANREAA
jgi:predicted DNA-binding transcriptional regulator AlpA